MANRDITIKRNNSGTIDALLPTTHVGQIFTDSTLTTTLQSVLDAKIASSEKGAAGGVAPLDSNSKILPIYLPNWVGGGLVYRGNIVSGALDTAGELIAAVQALVTGDVTSAQQVLGSVWVVSADISFTQGTLPANTAIEFIPGDEGDATLPITLEAGDMIVFSKYVDSATDTFTFAVINNTYGLATASVPGIVEIGSDTVQSVAANAVTATASRTYATQLNGSGQLVVNVPWTDTDTVYTLPAATSTILGGVKLASDTVQSVAANSVSTTASRTYGVQINSSGQMVVNVPWVDTNTDTTYTAGIGLVLTGTTFKANLIDETAQTVAANSISTTASRTYAVQQDSDGDLVVNVPWTDTNTTYSQATTSTLGLVKLGVAAADQTVNTASTTAGRFYPVGVKTTGEMYVNVPWVDTDTVYSLPSATASILGGVKLGSDTQQSTAANAVTSTASRSYAVQVNASGQMLVNVPWTDTDTNTYVTSAAFNTGTGVLTLTRNDAATVTVDLDGKYLEASDLTNRPEVYYANTTPTTGWSNGDLWLDFAG